MRRTAIFLVLTLFLFLLQTNGSSLADIESWGYQLQNVNVSEIANAPFDIVVIDYSKDGTNATAWSETQVEQMSNNKLVVSYISIGEAEDYRYYWNDSWKTNPPEWLDQENPNWEGNFKVKYWMAGWQSIIFDYLQIILNQGFDGIYLDIIDAYEYYEDQGVDNAATLMINWVKAIANFTRSQNADFLIIPQNGEGLLENETYRDTINGIGIEDLFFTGNEKNSDAVINNRLSFLKLLPEEKKVLVVDYISDASLQKEFRNLCMENGFIPYSTVRSLDTLQTPVWMTETNNEESSLFTAAVFATFPLLAFGRSKK